MSSERITLSPELLRAEVALHDSFEQWLDNHVDDYLGKLPYDRNTYPHQRLDCSEILPIEPSLESAKLFGEAAVGQDSYQEMLTEISKPSYGLLDKIRTRLAGGQNILIATGHYKNVWDTALSHNALFYATQDESFASKNVIVANMLMSRLAVGGIPVTNLLANSGKVLLGIPPGHSAEKAGVESTTISYVNRQMGLKLKLALSEGAVLHRALSDSVAKEVLDEGISKIAIPRVKDEMAMIVRKRIEFCVPWAIALGQKPSTTRSKVMDARYLTNIDEVHYMMKDLAINLSDLSGEDVIYRDVSSAQLVADTIGRLATNKH